jgi:NTE family protein
MGSTPRRGDTAALQRWARLLSGHGVGVVFSGGGGRGFAQLGAHRALLDLGVPVDALGGASIGGAMAAAIAVGLDPETTEAHVASHFHKLFDYTLPVTALLKGQRITTSIRAAFGSYDIEDLWLPFYCVSTNLTQSRLELHDRGGLATAIRATVAIPGMLPPVPKDGDLLIDGGVLDNLPARPMKADGSIGTVVAVDVAPPLGPAARVDYGHAVSGWRAIVGRMRGHQPSPPIASILMRTTLTAAVQDRERLLDEGIVDLHLPLEMRGVSLLDFERVPEVAAIGYEQARPQLVDWLASPGAPARWRSAVPARPSEDLRGRLLP